MTPVNEASGREERRCPHCAASHVHRWGKPGGTQRYRCRSCGRTFNALTGTSCAGLRRPELWIDYRAAIVEQLSIREAAKRCGINPSTALRWRRRFTSPSAGTAQMHAASAHSQPTEARPADVDFVDWVHSMRAEENGRSMQAHVEHMFGLHPCDRTAGQPRTTPGPPRPVLPRPGRRRDHGR